MAKKRNKTKQKSTFWNQRTRTLKMIKFYRLKKVDTRQKLDLKEGIKSTGEGKKNVS